ncbi:electron transfer flavoprotein subunit beta/FixA family protein [Uliginosibacterium flavum]|uniref:Electron transfer flavoprotein subunit beta n=1 Tax=Uliginosibacterium flavum TaxID=1396831 RepID=A0ABV2TP19_9RHOO
MKILVPVKRVVDYLLRVRVREDGSGVDSAGLKMSMNPFDEIALEEAVRLREAGVASEVVVVSCGVSACQETLRTALAMGADRAVLIETDALLQPLAVAKLLKALAQREAPRLVIMGKQAIDDDANQCAQMLAAMLGWPQATFASKLLLSEDTATVSREIDGGLETLELSLPAVISTDLRLNEPRYASLPNVMKARRAQIEILPAADLQVDLRPRLTTLRVAAPPVRAPGVRVDSAEALAERLRLAMGATP